MTAFMDNLSVHANALNLRSQRNELLASNIANAATPHFKARDIDFKAHMQTAMGHGSMSATNDRHFSVGGTTLGDIGFRKPTMASLDGNTVELAVEQMQFAENTVRYQSSLEFLNSKISGLKTAMRGE